MILQSLAARPQDDYVLVRMRETADLTDEAQLPRGAERRTAVWNDLVATAQRTQQPVLERLEQLRAAGSVLDFRSIPIANAIAIHTAPRAQSAVADALRGVAEIGNVLAHKSDPYTMPSPGRATKHGAPASQPTEQVDARLAPSPDGVEWNIRRIGAPNAWARGYDGSGLTIGIVDGGLDSAHPGISSHYRGTNADGSVDHEYNWLDAIGHTTGSFTAQPHDPDGHGTHVAGTAAGGSAGDAIGVAPGAKLIAARIAFVETMASPISSLDALQFMLAPTRTDGTNPDPRRGADIVNNSWSASPWEAEETRPAFAALKAAGIDVVLTAGNSGPAPDSIRAPGKFPGFYTVASTDRTDTMARSSAAGPDQVDPLVPSPTFAAPGVDVRSAVPGGYRRLSGTSMAAPAFAGALAILRQAAPDATYDEIVRAFADTAVDVDRAGTDARSGFGRIDVDAALERLLAAREHAVA